MIFYHYTSREHLAAIMRTSLSRGDVPLTPFGEGLNGVWLTTDPTEQGHGLSENRELTDSEREAYLRWKGVSIPEGARFQNRREVRIKIKLPINHINLKRWFTWSASRVDPIFREMLIQSGGGKSKAKTWYVYFGSVEPYEFLTVEFLDGTDLITSRQRTDPVMGFPTGDVVQLTAGEAVQTVNDGFGHRAIYRLAEKGLLPCVRKGRRPYFRRSELERTFSADVLTTSMISCVDLANEFGGRSAPLLAKRPHGNTVWTPRPVRKVSSILAIEAESKTDGYAVFNLGGELRPMARLTVFITVRNLFDKHYSTAAELGATAFDAAGNYVARPFNGPVIDGARPLLSSTFYAPGAPRSVEVGASVHF